MFMLCYEKCEQKFMLCRAYIVLSCLDYANVLLCNYAGIQVMILQND